MTIINLYPIASLIYEYKCWKFPVKSSKKPISHKRNIGWIHLEDKEQIFRARTRVTWSVTLSLYDRARSDWLPTTRLPAHVLLKREVARGSGGNKCFCRGNVSLDFIENCNRNHVITYTNYGGKIKQKRRKQYLFWHELLARTGKWRPPNATNVPFDLAEQTTELLVSTESQRPFNVL